MKDFDYTDEKKYVENESASVEATRYTSNDLHYVNMMVLPKYYGRIPTQVVMRYDLRADQSEYFEDHLTSATVMEAEDISDGLVFGSVKKAFVHVLTLN